MFENNCTFVQAFGLVTIPNFDIRTKDGGTAFSVA